MFNAVLTSRGIFICLDVFSLVLKQVWTYSVLGDRIYEMRKATESGQQGIKTGTSFLLQIDPW